MSQRLLAEELRSDLRSGSTRLPSMLVLCHFSTAIIVGVKRVSEPRLVLKS